MACRVPTDLLLVVSCVLKKMPPRKGLKKRSIMASEKPSACSIDGRTDKRITQRRTQDTTTHTAEHRAHGTAQRQHTLHCAHQTLHFWPLGCPATHLPPLLLSAVQTFTAARQHAAATTFLPLLSLPYLPCWLIASPAASPVWLSLASGRLPPGDPAES